MNSDKNVQLSVPLIGELVLTIPPVRRLLVVPVHAGEKGNTSYSSDKHLNVVSLTTS